MNYIESEYLVDLWLRHMVNTKEDFDVMVIEFLETMKEDISIYDVLNEARMMALEKIAAQQENIPLLLSHKAFNTSLEYQLRFWGNIKGK